MSPQKPAIDDIIASVLGTKAPNDTAKPSIDDIITDVLGTKAESKPTQKLSVLEMGRTRVTSDAPDVAPSGRIAAVNSWISNATEDVAQSMAHPQTGMDFLALGGLKTAPAPSVVKAGTKAAMRVAGPAMVSTAGVIDKAANSKTVDVASKAAAAFAALFGHIGPSAVAYKAPTIGRTVAKGVEAVGEAVSRGGAVAAPALDAATVAQRAAQIPLKERLAQIPLQEVSDAWTAAKSAQPGSSLADDVLMVRGLVAKGFNPAVAVKVASGADANYAESVAKAWTQSLKAKGAPIPESALAVSGKVSPAVTELMNSPTFQALAQSLKARTP